MIDLLKVEFRIIGLRRDDDGRVMEEVPLMEGAAYEAGIDNLPAQVRDVLAQANALEGE